MNSKRWRERSIPILLVLIIVSVIILVIQSFRIPSESKQVKVGAVLIGSKADGGWNESHFNGLMKASQKHGCEFIHREYVAESGDEGTFYEAVDGMIAKGVNVIFLTSNGYGKYLDKIAERYPNVAFFCISGHGKAKNCTSYFARLYQVRYLSGLVAGALTKTGVLGYVAAMPNSQTNRGINAYAMGVRRANPQAKLLVRFTGSWDNEQLEQESVVKMAAAGADVFTYHEDKPNVIKKAEAMGLYTVGYGSTNAKYSQRYLTAALYDWDVVYEKVLSDFLIGKVNMSKDYWLDITEGGVRLDRISPLAEQQTLALVDLELQRIRKQDVFSGVIYDNEGRLRCGEGEQISDEQLFYGMDWFVEGVEIYD
ncbi:MAG: BMP family ABC transporter substrate-binding protein [Selenomonas sp.]|nr:BMP family ABC transporter substrate-binding protein [Selenomonas sp.]